MPYVPAVVVNEAEIAKALKKAEKALKPDVVRIRYSLGDDWIGAPSIFFRAVITDDASQESKLREVSRRIKHEILNAVDAYEMGLQSYFYLRNLSEQKQMKEKSWE